MPRVFTGLLFLLALSLPAAAGSKEDACLLEASARLPAVQGLKVVNSSARPSTVPPLPKIHYYDVFLSVEAAGRSVKYQFMCRENGSEDVMIVSRKVLD